MIRNLAHFANNFKLHLMKLNVSEFFQVHENDFAAKMAASEKLDPRDPEFKEMLKDADKCVMDRGNLSFSFLVEANGL